MSIQLTVIMRSTTGRFDQTAAIGSVDLDAALDWVDEITAVAMVVETIDSPERQFNVCADFLLTPGGKNLYRFDPDTSRLQCFEYQFSIRPTDDPHELLELIDKFTAVQLRLEGNLTSAS